MAINVLNECYIKDESNAESILLNKLPEFGDLTCLQVAVIASDLAFVSHPCVQGLLTKIWYNKIMIETPKIMVSLYSKYKN